MKKEEQEALPETEVTESDFNLIIRKNEHKVMDELACEETSQECFSLAQTYATQLLSKQDKEIRDLEECCDSHEKTIYLLQIELSNLKTQKQEGDVLPNAEEIYNPVSTEKQEWLSKCCSAELNAHIGDEGTGCYICSKCGKACDLKQEELIYEQDLPEHISQDEYDEWFKTSKIVDGVRMGKPFPFKQEKTMSIEQEAIKFAEWIIIENWNWNGDMQWERKISGMWQYKTTEELYNQFKKH